MEQSGEKIPESFSEAFVRKYGDRIKDSSLENILFEFMKYLRPEPGEYSPHISLYVNSFLNRYSDYIGRVPLLVSLDAFYLFSQHCNAFAVNWAFYSYENGLIT